MVPLANSKASRARFRVLGRKEDLVERVVRAIESEIFARRLPVGTRLPPEREFSERLGVSRTVVREAVRILVTKGLLDTRHGIGTSVRAVTRHEVLEPLTLFLRSCDEKVTIDHLHQVRSTLEVESAGVAAEHATEADIEDLRRICTEMEAVASEPEQFAQKDAEFHRRLSQTTHNPLMTLLLDSIRDLMAEVRTLVAREPGLFERVMPTHVQILECVASRDVQGARSAMREHLSTALRIQRELIEQRQRT
jgi:GntR family transcriptional repressor for pyruvate dehydrogenase complex